MNSSPAFFGKHKTTKTPNIMETPIPETPEQPPVANGEYLYFQKVLLNIAFHINRVRVNFETLSSNIGVLKISAQDPMAPALTAAAAERRGGIVKIDAATYDGLKKKLPFNPLEQRFKKPLLQVMRTEFFNKKPNQPGANAAVANPFSGRATGVATAGGRGTGGGAGTPTPAPVPPDVQPGEFQPATGKKNYKMPVVKKTTSRSLEGGIPEPEPTG